MVCTQFLGFRNFVHDGIVVLQQPFAALISGPGNSGLPLAALDDGDFEMRARNRHHPPLITSGTFSCKNYELMVLLA